MSDNTTDQNTSTLDDDQKDPIIDPFHSGPSNYYEVEDPRQQITYLTDFHDWAEYTNDGC